MAPSRLLFGVPSSSIIVSSILAWLLGIHAADRVEDLAVDRLDGLAHALAADSGFCRRHAVDRLMRAGGGAGGNRGAAERAILKDHIDFDGGIAAAVENFAGHDVGDGGHKMRRFCCVGVCMGWL